MTKYYFPKKSPRFSVKTVVLIILLAALAAAGLWLAANRQTPAQEAPGQNATDNAPANAGAQDAAPATDDTSATPAATKEEVAVALAEALASAIPTTASAPGAAGGQAAAVGPTAPPPPGPTTEPGEPGEPGAADSTPDNASTLLDLALQAGNRAMALQNQGKRLPDALFGAGPGGVRLNGETVEHSTVSRGDTAGGILQKWLNPGEVNEVVTVCQEVYSLKDLRQGQSYAVTEDDDGFTRFEYEIDKDKKLIVCREAQTFRAYLEDIEYDVLLAKVDGVINSNLFNAMYETGENASLAIAMSEIFAWEVNFIKDLQPGDTFSLIVEKRFRDGEFKGYGPLLAARLTNSGHPYEAFRFEDQEGDPQYFTAIGDSVKRAFLKAPLSFTRISSNFTNRRLHPILKVYRPHPGVDYAAPKGTPVKAIGRGTVTYVGWGDGAGNYIALQHGNSYESTYMHLSAFAAGLKKGNTVKQGEVIGYVGSTGYATGPHLDFRMKKNGVLLNPLEVLSPRDTPVRPARLEAFKDHVNELKEYLDEKRPLPN